VRASIPADAKVLHTARYEARSSSFPQIRNMA
jgi:hypothetical protein